MLVKVALFSDIHDNNNNNCLFSAKMCFKCFGCQGKRTKNKKQSVFKCFPVTSLKLLISNWEALIPFLLVSLFWLKSKDLLLNFFSYVWSPFWLPKAQGLGPWHPHPPRFKPPMGGRFSKKFSSTWKVKIKNWIQFCVGIVLTHKCIFQIP